MTTLEKLKFDIENDSVLDIEERYDLLKRDAETIAKRLDAVVAMLEPGEKPKYCSFDIHRIYRELYKEWEWKTSAHTRAVAIAEGRKDD